MSNSSIWPIDKTLSGATIPGQSGPGSNGNEGVLQITQISPSDNLVLYPGYSLEGWSSLSAEIPKVYSTAPADLAGLLLNKSNYKLLVRLKTIQLCANYLY